MSKELTKDYIGTTLQEERLWKTGKEDTFFFNDWHLTLRKEEEKYKPFTFSVVGVHTNGSSWNRRYLSMEKAFLHIVNNFNENANIENNYKSIEKFMTSK